jgi:hypothetical protein
MDITGSQGIYPGKFSVLCSGLVKLLENLDTFDLKPLEKIYKYLVHMAAKQRILYGKNINELKMAYKNILMALSYIPREHWTYHLSRKVYIKSFVAWPKSCCQNSDS